MEKRKEADDVYDYGYSLRNSLKRLEESKILSEGDKDIIGEFLEQLRAKRVSTGRLAKYGFTIRRLTEHIGVPIRSATRKDIERLSIWVQEQGYSPHTIQDSLFAIKYFYKFVRTGNTDHETPFPEEVRWLKVRQKANEKKQPEFFTPNEVESLIKCATRLRDKCMLSVAFERGLRPSELLLLNVGDVTFDYEREYASRHTDLPARLFLSVGSLEDGMVTNLKELIAVLKERRYTGLDWESHVFEGETHISVGYPAICRGMTFVFAK